MKIPKLLFLITTLLAGIGSAHAMFIQPEPVPIERLLKSAEAYLAANPKSAEAHYTLARIHYLAFARSSGEVPANLRRREPLDDRGKPLIAADWQLLPSMTRSIDDRASQLARDEVGFSQPHPIKEREKFFQYKAAYDRHFVTARMEEYRRQQQERWTNSAALSNEKALAHVTAALAEFREAMRLPPEHQTPNQGDGPPRAPTIGLSELGLASLMEQFADWKQVRKPAGLTAELEGIDHRQARDAYLIAYRLAAPHDTALNTRPTEGFEALVSYESATAFIRLAGRDPKHREAKGELAKALAEVKAGLAKIGQLQMGAITPIVFSLQPGQSIEDLLAPETIVDFDLRGFGPAQRWPWVKPGTALLVWDPEREGQVRSARQLFGGYTFEIFWTDGYAALAALDGDDDGALRGAELDGLRAWFDANGNGRSDFGEVKDLDEFGIVAVAVRAITRQGVHPTNPRGLQFKDGRTLPTWDWMVKPVRLPSDKAGLFRSIRIASSTSRYAVTP